MSTDTIPLPIGSIPKLIEGTPLAVRTQGLGKRYGRTEALRGLELTVPEGSFFLLVGPNGAGKSTTLRILLDIVRASQGSADVFGMDTRSGAKVRAQIGWVPETHGHPNPWMRVSRIISTHASFYPAWDATYAAHLSKVLEIKVDRKFQTLSKGEARRVQILMALAHRPPLLLLDEPTDGLDPFVRETVVSVLAEHLAETPTTVIASTHLIAELDGLADHLGVLKDGEMVTQIRRDELEKRLRSYSLEVPTDWNESVRKELRVVRGNGRLREREWIVWGEAGNVVKSFANSGVTVRDIAPVTLRDAAVALIGRQDAADE